MSQNAEPTWTPPQHPVVVLMGVSGSGKSTIALRLEEATGWDFLEGDDLHPQANVDKMASGTPLTDEDRWPWLEAIASWIREHTAAGRAAIVTCSALKRAYRDILRVDDNVVFVFLHGSVNEIGTRVRHRKHQYMPPSLLDSQFQTLESPAPDEHVVTVDVDRTPREITATILETLHQDPESQP
ncbi:gluconokinase [Rhodococcus rhodnii]|uniref:Gluconokinase n=2 Tax=Rhodococcus rhodnii TaxID=38312 RepID=R7WNY4_9NOCA|nr:gluconokinase [Rhodococcus rhodnii]EOM77023.1 gluconokinase [Rhodococcus rhodnii LMG 5362]TXG89903.1 gluconokinase [Rhodococcus rhodnii]